jgi:uncharacterized protein DUF262
MRFEDIPQFTRSATYAVDIPWFTLERHFMTQVREEHLDPNPDFQRGYVWTPEQKTRYIEFALRGGKTGRDIYTNHPSWNRIHGRSSDAYVLVDGKQRLEAVFGFLHNRVPVFGGHYFQEFTDALHLTGPSFRWHVNDLKTRAEVLQWYIDLNSGGTVHGDEEINRVRALLEAER